MPPEIPAKCSGGAKEGWSGPRFRRFRMLSSSSPSPTPSARTPLFSPLPPGSFPGVLPRRRRAAGVRLRGGGGRPERLPHPQGDSRGRRRRAPGGAADHRVRPALPRPLARPPGAREGRGSSRSSLSLADPCAVDGLPRGHRRFPIPWPPWSQAGGYDRRGGGFRRFTSFCGLATWESPRR